MKLYEIIFDILDEEFEAPIFNISVKEPKNIEPVNVDSLSNLYDAFNRKRNERSQSRRKIAKMKKGFLNYKERNRKTEKEKRMQQNRSKKK